MGAELKSELPRRILLLGFMGAGKSTVGPILARRLGWRFLDLDAAIEAAEGISVAEIFASRGEPEFRRLEAEATRHAMRETKIVVAPGGGWVANTDAASHLAEGTVRVWLRVSVEETLRRLRSDAADRPLLAVPDPAARARELLALREPLYRHAELSVSAEGRTASEIAAEIETLLKGRGPAAPSS